MARILQCTLPNLRLPSLVADALLIVEGADGDHGDAEPDVERRRDPPLATANPLGALVVTRPQFPEALQVEVEAVPGLLRFHGRVLPSESTLVLLIQG